MSTTELVNNSKLSTELKQLNEIARNFKIANRKRFQRITNLEESYFVAFNKVSNNHGAGTSGVDGETISGYKLKDIQRIHQLVRQNKYTPKPVKYVEIPKGDDKTRPLGLPTIKDRVVLQEVIRTQLEAVYEPLFSEWSYGFRPGKSCHDALKRFTQRFKGINYFIKIDLKDFFGTVSHEVLNKILLKNIRKHKFIKIIYEMLKSGVMKQGNVEPTYSGTPQGGIISPILSNIMLNELDKFVDNKLKSVINGRWINKIKPEYRNKVDLIHKEKKANGKTLTNTES